MRAKTKASDIAAEIKKLVESKKAVIGTERAIKSLKLGKVEKVFLSSNCPKDVTEDIEYYSKIAKVPVIKLKYSNADLGVMCKKSHSISVLSVPKV